MDLDFNKLLQNVSKVKLHGGVFGKSCIVLVIVSFSMLGITWAVKLAWISALALVLLFTLVFIILWKLISFAAKNPQAAILEGAEFLTHERLQLAAKGKQNIPFLPSDFSEEKPLVLGEEEKKLLDVPDEEHIEESEV